MKEVFVVLHKLTAVDAYDTDSHVKGVFYDYLDAVACVEKFCNTEMDRCQNVTYIRTVSDLGNGAKVPGDIWFSQYDKLWLTHCEIK